MDITPEQRTAELLYAGDRVGRVILENALRSGEIESVGKSDSELAGELLDYLRAFRAREDVQFQMIVDHTDDILDDARAFASEGKTNAALTFYATWFEHWINGVITTSAERRGMSGTGVVQMLRDSNLRAKTSWLLEILGLPSLPEAPQQRMLRITELRNSYIHYKWAPFDANASESERQAKLLVRTIDQDIHELVMYEERTLADEARTIVQRLFPPPLATEETRTPRPRN